MSPFNCFSSPGHVETLPRHYTPHHVHSSPNLPQLQATPPRSPSRSKSTRRSFDGVGRDRLSLKGKIGSPTGFKHVGHLGGDGAFGGAGQQHATSLAALTTALSPQTGLDRRASLSAPPSAPSSRGPPAPCPSADLYRSASDRPFLAGKHHSLQPPHPAPFSDASNRSPTSPSPPSAAAGSRRPVSAQPPIKRKAAPQVTASVIRAVPGGMNEVEKSGPVPTLAKVKAGPVAGGLAAVEEGEIVSTSAESEGKKKDSATGTIALQDLFTRSEIAAIQHYQDSTIKAPSSSSSPSSTSPQPTSPPSPLRPAEQGGHAAEGTAGLDGPQTKIFKGALADIEKALREAA
ncbi:hypothetical protein JCM11641_002690 [Rhodosporidiobolus odoratus]